MKLTRSDLPPIWLVALLCAVAGAVLLLSGCSSTPSIKDDVEKLAKLSPAGQAAVILETPLLFLAVSIALFATSTRVTKIVHKHREGGGKG